MNDIPGQEEITQRLEQLNAAYTAYRALCGPGEHFDAAQKEFYQCKHWFEERGIELRHIGPRDPWTLA